MLRAARSERRRARPPRSRSSRGCCPPTSGTVEVLGRTLGSRRRTSCARASAWRCRRRKLFDRLTVEETLRLFRTFYPRRARSRSRRCSDEMQLEREAVDLGDEAVGRAAAAAGGGAGAGRRSGGAVPRRADHRPRPAVAAGALGHDRGAAHARQDRGAHHPLHGRGGAPLRSGGHRRSRQAHRARHAEPSSSIGIGGHHLVELATDPALPPRRWPACAASVRFAAAGTATASRCRSTSRTSRLPALVARLDERGVRPTRLVSRTATLDDVFLSLTGRTLRED